MFCEQIVMGMLDGFCSFLYFLELCCNTRSFFLSLAAVNHNDFQIITGNEQRKFSIDSTTGEVTVASKLNYDDPVRDRNVSSFFLLEVIAALAPECS